MIAMQRADDLDIVQGTRYSGASTGAGVYGWNLKRKLVSRGATRSDRGDDISSVCRDVRRMQVASFRSHLWLLMYPNVKATVWF